MYRPGPRVGGLAPRRNLVARPLAAALHRHAGGPLVVPRTSEHSDISSWQVMLRRCPGRTGAFFLRRTIRAVAASWGTGACEARRHPTSPRGPRDVGSSYPRLRRAGLSTPTSPPAWHEPVTVRRQKSGGGAVHASTCAERHGGRAILEPSVVRA